MYFCCTDYRGVGDQLTVLPLGSSFLQHTLTKLTVLCGGSSHLVASHLSAATVSIRERCRSTMN
jgi:hypothetical protein